MTADIICFETWRAQLRAETQEAPVPAPESTLTLQERAALQLASRTCDAAVRSAARFRRQGREAEAWQALRDGYDDLRALATAYPMPPIIERMQILDARRRQEQKRQQKRRVYEHLGRAALAASVDLECGS